jgi:hypothetical protein
VSSKVHFFYANGTNFLFNIMEIGFSVDIRGRVSFGGGGEDAFTFASVPGLEGKTAAWDGLPANDPFPSLLDSKLFDVSRIRYPAASFPMGASITAGIEETIDQINALPPGKPFCLGGYSQGAAVMSGVYNELRYGSLTSKLPQFLGAVMFGNPRRQQNHRGIVGGDWSGGWDIPDSNYDGRGSFPATGPFARLQNCGDEWVEFTNPGDIFSSTGSSATGINWTTANNTFLDLNLGSIVNYFATGLIGSILAAVELAFSIAGIENVFIDAEGKEVSIAGSGHTAYPFVPPPDDPFNGATSYQIALAYLEALAYGWVTAPVAVNPRTAGWSTTLLPPPA